MPLTFRSEITKDQNVVVIRCQGRVVGGAEIEALEAEIEKQTSLMRGKWVVLHLAEVNYIDSAGLGGLIRKLGILRAAGGGLNLCHASPAVVKVLQITKLFDILLAHSSEQEAIAACYSRPRPEAMGLSPTRIVCIGTSKDLLAYLRALLTSSGYEVHTASNLTDGKTLVSATKPQLIICGEGVLGLPAGKSVVEGFRQDPNLQILHLPPEFSTAEAGQAGVDLVNRVQSLLTGQPLAPG